MIVKIGFLMFFVCVLLLMSETAMLMSFGIGDPPPPIRPGTVVLERHKFINQDARRGSPEQNAVQREIARLQALEKP